jgi:CHAD domain-containing protein
VIQQAAQLAMSDDARVERKRNRAVLPCTPADEAAVSLVRGAMESLVDAMERLGNAGVKDADGVHQARVSTRRAEAALLAFRGVIDDPSERRIRRRLGEVRRCAGEIRKCDVQTDLLDGLLESAGADERLVIDAMKRRLRRRRRQSVRGFRPLLSGRQRRRLERASSRLALNVARTPDETLDDVAVRALPARAADMDVLCRTPDPTADELHELRIAGKRARYVLEVVGLCVDPGAFSAAYRRMEQFQELLGAYNDDHELAQYLEKSSHKRRKLAKRSGLDVDRVDAAIESLHRQVTARCAQRRVAFLEWWGGDEARSLIDLLMGRGTPTLPALMIEGASGRHIAC